MEVLRCAKPRAFRPRKCSESGSSVLMTKGCRAFLIAGSGSCGSPKQRRGREKHARAGGNEPGTTRGRATARPQKLRRGPAARAASLARNICPNLDSISKTDLETQRTDSAQSARQGGTEPGTTRFKDGRATTGPPAPRRGPGAPTVQPRPRGLDPESAQV